MTLIVNKPSRRDRTRWQTLYRGYADFFHVPMNDEILNTVWDRIHDVGMPFFGLIAKDETGNVLGSMPFREIASPLRAAFVGFLDDLFVTPVARGHEVVEVLYDAPGELPIPFSNRIAISGGEARATVQDLRKGLRETPTE